MDPEAFTILDSLDIQSPPVFITASGNQVTNQFKKCMVHFLPIKPLRDGAVLGVFQILKTIYDFLGKGEVEGVCEVGPNLEDP